MAVKQHWTTRAGQATGHPAAFGLVIVYGLLWFYFSKATFEWNAAATLAVWVMIVHLAIESPGHPRVACQTGRTVDSCARSELARLDEQEPEVIQKHRDNEVQQMPQ